MICLILIQLITCSVNFKFYCRLELEHNYITKQGNTWNEDRKCGNCGALISTREEYVHHLGVSHRHVLQFLPAKFRPPAPEPVKVTYCCLDSKVYSQTVPRRSSPQRRRCSVVR